MPGGLNALQAALDVAVSPVAFFLRDDDAGWEHARLFSLLDCAEYAGVPIDLAVIPQACSDALAHALCARVDASPSGIGLHQHGFAHVNHERTGRKCEFGGTRSVDVQRHDLITGRERLRDGFGARLDAIFTPPWNRCSPATPALLAELGYRALSRDRSAPAQFTLPELPVAADWSKQQRLAAQNGEDIVDRIGFELARHIGAGYPVGLMLHHADMDAPDLQRLETVLVAASLHPRARWLPMAGLLIAHAPFELESSLTKQAEAI